ncbi:interferon-inducible double-stranded RNA-dependent protein kinase activator A homolog isoform X4 [Vespa mandarinia]|uniref:interferon-inducible double-stranded RNA-dependent protein kinase activator A homolog isoform X4 n=1 Tax=Vespa mandarinia TaxID=7446 RepID=UPI001622025A|nr:interferon-inducible double-stranded RNA-dependent protein kinase activator A homolog isoform X4 [Vespa mandarinia]XP_046835645.1 interferon-inducible double-stranded RNA-dependent protein kinase activator A homolog isoform X4 [Vespa crabro]XP_047365554.1 interferon-inducible double-stranded RNA-dependent protein kinase activator A homolog isoform X4 [Vespa velutina]
MEEMRQQQQVGPTMLSNVGNVPNHSNNAHRRSRTRITLHAMMSESLSLPEAARLEMEALPNKTPVSVLQELLSRRGTIPKYELVQVEGVIHEPTFRYRVTVADVVAMGTGRSKKEAKHAAAKAVLDKLIGVNIESAESPLPKSLADSQNLPELEGYGEEKGLTNPIGVLQEMCMSRHWPPPKYTMEGEEGLPHERKFTIVCSILSFREVGYGKSKKIAKRHAAHKMWLTLHDTNNQTNMDGDENTCLNDGDVNLVQFLQEIASEQQFEVTYVDIEEKSISGKCQCLVQLSTLPVAVCYGCGVTSKDAQASAAQNALEYLKIMTKK